MIDFKNFRARFKNKDYNIITLRPIDKEEESLFFKFRIDDIKENFALFLFGAALYLLGGTLAYLVKRNKESLLIMLQSLTTFLFTLILWFFRKRIKDKFGIAILVLSLMISLIRVFTTSIQIQRETDPLQAKELLTYSNGQMSAKMFITVIFLSPSHIYVFTQIVLNIIGWLTQSYILCSKADYDFS